MAGRWRLQAERGTNPRPRSGHRCQTATGRRPSRARPTFGRNAGGRLGCCRESPRTDRGPLARCPGNPGQWQCAATNQAHRTVGRRGLAGAVAPSHRHPRCAFTDGAGTTVESAWPSAGRAAGPVRPGTRPKPGGRRAPARGSGKRSGAGRVTAGHSHPRPVLEGTRGGVDEESPQAKR